MSYNLDNLKLLCNQYVISLLGEELAPKWWSSPNRAFDGKSPEEQWLIRPMEVFNYLSFHVYDASGS